ncbi:MAG TPA: hypothetical protein VNA04_01385 [Thermoanaerobaculia bacterium]|nr:hypothetical protein [Thermoanaerobaculia bacterium]
MRKPLFPLALLLLAGCASSGAPVDMDEPRRVVGTQNNVRIDAQIFGDRLSPAIRIPFKYDITNQRSQTILVADLVPEVTYDEETQTVTVGVGSEVPGASFLPRLIAIPPGEKRTFSSVARVHLVVARTVTPLSRFPRALRVKLSFLGDTAEFEQLIAIPERGVFDPELADELFPIWVERNETVYTNSLPMRWGFEPQADPTMPRPRGRRG